MNIKTKNIVTLVALALLVVVMASCNRGGTGCPYELEAAGNALISIMK